MRPAAAPARFAARADAAAEPQALRRPCRTRQARRRSRRRPLSTVSSGRLQGPRTTGGEGRGHGSPPPRRRGAPSPRAHALSTQLATARAGTRSETEARRRRVVPSGATGPFAATSTAPRSPTRAPSCTDGGVRAPQGTAITRGRHRRLRSRSRLWIDRLLEPGDRRGRGVVPAPAQPLGLSGPSGSRAGPRGRHAPARTPSRCPWSPRATMAAVRQRRQPAEPLPLQLDTWPVALRHLAREEGRGVIHAREGYGGAAAEVNLDRLDLPAVARVLVSRDCDRHHRARLCRARRPTPRLGVPSDPVRIRVPSGKMTTAWPRSRSIMDVLTDSSSASPRLTGKAPRQLRNQPTSRYLNSSRLATKKSAARCSSRSGMGRGRSGGWRRG